MDRSGVTGSGKILDFFVWRIDLKRFTMFVLVALIGISQVGCSEDLNKNVPKSLPPGAKPFQTQDKGPGGAGENVKTQDRAK